MLAAHMLSAHMLAAHMLSAHMLSVSGAGERGPCRCAITYFGEGCAQEGDISSALNIAAVTRHSH